MRILGRFSPSYLYITTCFVGKFRVLKLCCLKLEHISSSSSSSSSSSRCSSSSSSSSSGGGGGGGGGSSSISIYNNHL